MSRRLYHSFAMASLDIYAGPAAMRRLRKEGICQPQFEVLVAASGGPKWFVLAGLDRYLFGSFFVNRASELFTIGSSVGAWRVCCLATHDPVASVERLAHFYCHEKSSSAPRLSNAFFRSSNSHWFRSDNGSNSPSWVAATRQWQQPNNLSSQNRRS